MTRKFFKKKFIHILGCFAILCTQCQSNKDNKDSSQPIVVEKKPPKPSGSLDSIVLDEELLSKISSPFQLEIDADLDTQFFQKRIRFGYSLDDLWSCNPDFLDTSLVDKRLMRKLLLCKDNDSKDEIAYHMHLELCNLMQDNKIRIFTLDKAQKDSSILLVSIEHGDDYDNTHHIGTGVFLVFKKVNTEYKITDVGFGNIIALDIDKQDKIYPIIYGHTYLNLGYDSNPSHIEVRMKWEGKHFSTHEVVSFGTRGLSASVIKKNKEYSSLAEKVVSQSEDWQKGVKIHYFFRSHIRELRKEPRGKFYRDSIWTRGFKID
jgi:hypothetical protein